MEKSSLETIKELRLTLGEIIEDLHSLDECMGCRKGPCVSRINKRFGYVHKNAVYLSGGKFYIRKCAPVRRCGSANSLLVFRAGDGKFIFRLPEFDILEDKHKRCDINAKAILLNSVKEDNA